MAMVQSFLQGTCIYDISYAQLKGCSVQNFPSVPTGSTSGPPARAMKSYMKPAEPKRFKSREIGPRDKSVAQWIDMMNIGHSLW